MNIRWFGPVGISRTSALSDFSLWTAYLHNCGVAPFFEGLSRTKNCSGSSYWFHSRSGIARLVQTARSVHRAANAKGEV